VNWESPFYAGIKASLYNNNFGGPASDKERKSSMNKLSRFKVLGPALACAALVLGGTAAGAREFFANAGTTFVLAPVLATSPQQFSHTVDGVIQVSPLGSCTVHFDLIVTATASSTRPYLVSGTQTITTAKGDSSVTSSVDGYLSSNPANATFLGIHYKLKFTGGTGKLAHAHGSTVLTGFAALATAPGIEDFPGSIGVYPPNADLIAPPSGDLTGKACWLMQGNLELPGGGDDLDD
jgi:hypothetical protein